MSVIEMKTASEPKVLMNGYDRFQNLGSLVGTYHTIVAEVIEKKTTRSPNGGNVKAMVVGPVRLKIRKQTYVCDHLHLGNFPWSAWDFDLFKAGDKVAAYGYWKFYSSVKFGPRDMLGFHTINVRRARN